MPESDLSNDRDDSRIETILSSWFEAAMEGIECDIAELCADCPELIPRVRELLKRDKDIQGVFPFLDDRRSEELPVETLGEFRLIRPIGEGGMARVYLATQESLDRTVALKILRAPTGRDPHRLLRFRREAEITAALDHPNIVPVYGVGEENGFAYLAMKLLQGKTLEELVPLEAEEAARIAAAVARALHAAHIMGVIHRDVKPSNIIVDGDHPYVLDFGLARIPRDLTVTQEGSVPGTLPYMSPEQLRGDRSVLDARTDIYSLGATLYETLSGRPPFQAKRPEALIRHILMEQPPALKLNGRHRDLQTLIARAMDKDAGARFATAEEFALELERYAEGRPILTRSPGALTRTWRLASRHRAASLSVGSLLLACLVLLGFIAVQHIDRRRTLDRLLDRAAEAMSIGQYSACDDFLNDARELEPNDADLLKLSRHLEGLKAQEALLDAIQGNLLPSKQLLTKRREALRRSGGAKLRRPLADLATVVARLLADDKEGAHTQLQALKAEFGETAGIAALDAVATDQDPVAVLQRLPPPPAPGRLPSVQEADQQLFAAIAMRLAGSSPQDRQKQIRLAIDQDREHFRAHFELARLQDELGQLAVARATWEGLLLQGTRRPSVLRSLAREEMLLGELDRAERTLAASLDASTPTARDRPATRAKTIRLRVEILWRRGRKAQAYADLKKALKEFPGDAALLLLAGGIEAARAESDREGKAREEGWERAETHLKAASDSTPDQSLIDRAEMALLGIRYRRLPGAASLDPIATTDEGLRGRFRSLGDEALRVARRTRLGTVRSDALLLCCRAHWSLDERPEAWRKLTAALKADPQNSAARLRFALQVFRRLQGLGAARPFPTTDGRSAIRARIPRAIRLVRSLWNERHQGRRLPTIPELLASSEVGALLSAASGDQAEGARFLRQADDLLDTLGEEFDPQRQRIEEIRALIES